jgi:hypothetical protein
VSRRLAMPLAGLIALSLAAPAQAGEFRQLTLTDGRVLVAEVQETLPKGLRIRTPQGETTVIFEILMDMKPIGQSDYDAQTPWVVHLYTPAETSEEDRNTLVTAFSAIPQVDVWGEATTLGYLTEDQALALEGCEGDMDCLSKLSEDLEAPWMWIIQASPTDVKGEWSFRGGINIGDTRANSVAPSIDNIEVLAPALYQVLDLAPEKKLPKELLALTKDPRPGKDPKPDKEPKPAKELTEMTAEKVAAMSFVPLPGLPSLMQKDGANFGIALGVAVPVTALWVGAVGKSTQNTPEFALVSFAGFYATAVATSHALGMHSLSKNSKPVIMPTTTEDGGGGVMIGGSF